MVNEIGKKISDDLKKYLPLVHADLKFLKHSKLKADNRMDAIKLRCDAQDAEEEQMKNKNLEFQINIMKNDINIINRNWSDKKLEQLE